MRISGMGTEWQEVQHRKFPLTDVKMMDLDMLLLKDSLLSALRWDHHLLDVLPQVDSQFPVRRLPWKYAQGNWNQRIVLYIDSSTGHCVWSIAIQSQMV